MNLLYALLTFLLLLTPHVARAQASVPADTTPQEKTSAARATQKDPASTNSLDTTVIGTDSANVKYVVRDTIEYDADTIEYDVKTKTLLLTGNGEIHYRGTNLYADTIYYMIDEGTLLARGTPMLVERGDTVVGESMLYNLRTRRGKVRTSTATSSGSRYSGRFIAKSDSTAYYIDNGDYSSCAVVDTPHYTFYARKIKVLPSQKAISKPIVLNIGGSPVAALPYYIIPMEKGRQSGFLRPRWGGNVGSGGYLDNIGYYWAPNDYMDYSLSGKITEFRNWVVRASGAYALRYWFDGGISGEYARSEDISRELNRWSLNYRHNQRILPDNSMTLSGRGNLVSDKQYYKDNSEDTTQLLNQTIKANLNLNKRFTRINASGSLTWDRSHNLKSNEVDEVLPSVSFSLPSRPFIPHEPDQNLPAGEEDEPKWFNKIYFSYNTRGLQKREYNMADSLRDNRWIGRGASHSIDISSPQKFLKYFTLSPRFSFRQSVFDAYYDTTQYKIPIDTSYIETLTVVNPRDTIGNGEVVDWDTVDNEIRYFVRYDTTDTVIRYDTTRYDSADYHLEDAMTYSMNAGVSLSTTLYGLFPIKIFRFAGLRHTLTPSVSYNFRPEIEHGSDKNFPGIGIPVEKSLRRSQSVSMSLNNLFQGKVINPPKKEGGAPDEKKFNILNGSVSTGYNFEGEDRKWSDISVSASTSHSFLNVSFGANVTPYTENDNLTQPWVTNYNLSFRPKAINASGSFWGGDLLVLKGLHPLEDPRYFEAGMQNWSFNLSPSYSLTRRRNSRDEEFETDKIPQLSTSARLKFTRKWSMSWSGKFDFRSNRFVSNTVNFNADLECWDLNFEWRPSGYYSGFRFEVGIKKHRDIKWELRER